VIPSPAGVAWSGSWECCCRFCRVGGELEIQWLVEWHWKNQPRRPQVNVDETNKQLIQETRLPLPAQPGQPQRFDYEYERNGTRNLCLFVEPQTGQRHVHVTEQRTKPDFADAMQWLVDECSPEADVIRVVLDNLNTHKIASLYEAFAPAEARRIARKLELHYTPKHGSWFEHGGNRIACPAATMPRSPYPR
jgi:hypothetical protein